MADCNWMGKGYSADWADKKNWRPEQVPGKDDDVIVSKAETSWNSVSVPAGTKVKRLTLSVPAGTPGGLEGAPLSVTEQFTWWGGDLDAGLDAQTEVADVQILATPGFPSETQPPTLGAVLKAKDARLYNATRALGYAARISHSGHLESYGKSMLKGSGGSDAFLITPKEAVLFVGSGTLTVDDVILRATGTVDLAQGVVLSLEGRDGLHFLDSGARVNGSGKIRVCNGGRLLAVESALVATGVTLELAEGGMIEDLPPGKLPYPSLGPIQERQCLSVDGTLLWTGGDIQGEVLVKRGGMLKTEGPGDKWVSSGLLRILGGAHLYGPGPLKANGGVLRNDGEVVLHGDLSVGAEGGFQIENRGLIRTAGKGVVVVGDNPWTNEGTLDVREGTLHLKLGRSESFTQPAGTPRAAVLRIAPKAKLRCDRPLILSGGRLEGGGLVMGDVVQHGTTSPGDPDSTAGSATIKGKTAVLTIDGTYKQTETARLEVRLRGPRPGSGYDQLAVTGPVTLDGELRVTVAKDYQPDLGTRFAVVTGAGVDGKLGQRTGLGLSAERALYPVWKTDMLELLVGPVIPSTVGLQPLAGMTTPSYFNLRDAPNTSSKILGELNGTSVPVTVTDKAQDSSGRWLRVTLKAPIGNLPTGTQAWAIAWQKNGGPAVVAIADFEKLFWEQLMEFEDAHKNLSLDARITRLRQMSHESNLPFDHVIGRAKGPEYLDTREYIKDRWQLLMDYQIVAMPDGRPVDVYHLLVGLDVLTNRMVVRDPILGMPLGNNYSAATWAGDIGAGVADATVKADKDWEEKNANASLEQRIDRYFSTRASEADLLGTIDAWGINDERSLPRSTGSLADLLLSYYEDTRPGGERMLTTRRETAISTFLRDYGFKFDYEKHSYPETLVSQGSAANIMEAIRLFARVWIKGKLPSIPDPEPDSILLRAMTTNFLTWLEGEAIENGVKTE